MPFHHLLVPTDFSDCALSALGLAVRVAREHKASIALLHVGQSPGVALAEAGRYSAVLTPVLMTRYEDLARAQHEATETLGREHIPAEVSWRVVQRDGFPFEEILSEAKSGDYDLIVMGTHGRTGFDRVLLGSVVERVLRGATIPVLVTR